MKKTLLFCTLAVVLLSTMFILASTASAQTCPGGCLGNGNCQPDDTCDCNEGYTGLDCGINKCNGTWTNDPNVCSGNGVCKYDGTCSCEPGWTGNDCQTPVPPTCDGIPADDPSVCNGRGTCTAQDTCQCDDMYTGNNCETKKQCYGVDFDLPGVCGGQGECIDQDVCECDPWYWTENPGNPCGAPLLCGEGMDLYPDEEGCSWHGVCVYDPSRSDGIGMCECDKYFEGVNCIYEATCDGKEHWREDVCDGKGDCVAIDVCECENGVYGEFCTNDDRYCGSYLYNDPAACSHDHGTCVWDPDTWDPIIEVWGKYVCECFTGYYSPEEMCYNEAFCDYIIHTDPDSCGPNGDCVGDDVCECYTNWTGDNCDQQILCNGVFAGDPGVCSGNGICTQDGECVCVEGYTGANCLNEINDIDGDVWQPPEDCNDNNRSVNPGASEVCDNTIDDDCDTNTDCDDDDCSAFPACTCADADSDGYQDSACGGEDCDDSPTGGAINPGASEDCNDGIDNNCNDLTDGEDPDCALTVAIYITAPGIYTFGGLVNATVNATDVASPGTITITVHPDEFHPQTNADTVQVWYEITSTGSLTADLTLNFSGYNLNGEVAGDLRLWRYTGSDWEEHIGTVNIDDSVTVVGVSQFSDWTIADGTGGIQPPVPEIVTIVMISLGVLILGGFIWYRRREIFTGIASLFM